MTDEKALIQTLIADGRSGKGPRVFFGGPAPGDSQVNPEAPFFAGLLKEFPQMDILGVTMPTYFFAGPDYAHSGYVWLRQVRTLGKPQLLEEAQKSGQEFWLVDWCRHSKAHLGRFTLRRPRRIAHSR